MGNNIEKIPERILTKDEVMREISRYAENPEIVRILTDEHDQIYLIEAKISETNPGEITQYEYMRKGRFANGAHQASETAIHLMYYKNGVAAGGHKVTVYRPKTGEWEEVR